VSRRPWLNGAQRGPLYAADGSSGGGAPPDPIDDDDVTRPQPTAVAETALTDTADPPSAEAGPGAAADTIVEAAPPRPPWWRWTRRLLLGALALCFFGLAFVLAAFAVIAQSLPEINSLADYKPPMASKLYDRNGELLQRYFRERRTVVPLERVPEQVRHAFLAAEDAAFYRHKGLDYFAIGRAAINELAYRVIGGRRSGGSTITQQTAKTFFLSFERTYTRKIREMILAKRIEETLEKDDILYLYLNQIYFGHGAYGVEEAARTYYGRGVQDLTLGQAAALAAVPKSPSRINPFTNPTRTQERRAYVLEQMVQHGWTTAEAAVAAAEEPIRLELDRPPFIENAGYPAEVVRRRLEDTYGTTRLLEGGLRVYSTLDARLQVAAQTALQEGLREVDKRQGFRGPLLRLEPDERKAFVALLREVFARHHPSLPATDAVETSLLGRPVWDLSALDMKQVVDHPRDAAEATPTRLLRDGAIVGGVVTRIDSTAHIAHVDLGSVTGQLALEQMKWARPFSPSGWTPAPRDPADALRVGDVVLVRVLRENVLYAGKVDPDADADQPPPPVKSRSLDLALEQIPKVQGAIVAIEPHRHTVIAMAGGYDFARTSFDRVTQARRQPGSAFKPIVYSAGIASKLYTAASMVADAPKVFRDASIGKSWKPQNYDGKYRGDITLRECLTHSVNMCSIQVIERVGVEQVIDLAHRLGVASKLPQSLTLALGSGDVTPLEITNAYATIAAAGRFQAPVLVDHVKSRAGEALEQARYEQEEALDPNVAYIMTHLMRSVVEAGTAQRAKKLERPVAGKTGTSNEQRNAWFIGFTPDLVAGVFVGFDDNASLGRSEYGSRAALPIWLSFMQEAVKATPKRDFPAPDGVVFARVNKRDGLLTDAADPDGIEEVFLEGTQPTERHDRASRPPSLFHAEGAEDL